MNKPEILIIDDEPPIRKLLEITLSSNGYKIREATTAKEGITLTASHPPDLVILDIGLPDESGHIVLQKLRSWYNKPIIILSAQSDEEDIVQALDNGANDYLTKPFRTGELMARIRSVLRQSSNEKNETILTCGDLSADLTSRTIKKKDVILKLTATEYSLLVLLMKNEGKVMTHRFILKEVWGPAYINESQYPRVFIGQLRKKIEDDPTKPTHIITESGVGYRFL